MKFYWLLQISLTATMLCGAVWRRKRAKKPLSASVYDKRGAAEMEKEKQDASAADILAKEVVLAREIEPKFPNRCVVCNQPNDNELAEIRGEAVGDLGFEKWLLRESGKLPVPAHGRCSRKLKRRLFWRNIGVLTLATAIIVAWIVMGIYKVPMPFEVNDSTLYIAIVVTAVIIFVPLLMLEAAYPPAFRFSVGENNITYEFKNKDYAKEFERLNGA